MEAVAIPSGKPKRRILFIEKAFQFRFIVKVTAVVVLGTALTGGLLYFLADREFGRAFYSAHYQARSSWELLLPAVLVSSFIAMCLVAGLAVVLTLYDSHRIGGPLYRFKQNLKAIGEGDLTLLTRLRQGDELQALTEGFNEATRSLSAKVRNVSRADEEFRKALVRARQRLAEGTPLGLEDIDQLSAAEHQIRKALGAFRTDP